MEKLITNYNKNIDTSSGDQYITLAKIDVDKFEELSYKYNIKVVPTGKNSFYQSYENFRFVFLLSIVVLAIKNGKEINRFTGLIDEDRIETILDQLNR